MFETFHNRKLEKIFPTRGNLGLVKILLNVISRVLIEVTVVWAELKSNR